MKDIKEVLSKSKRSKIVKQAKKGHDFSKRGFEFKKGVKATGKEGYSKESPEKIAGASFRKQLAKGAKK